MMPENDPIEEAKDELKETPEDKKEDEKEGEELSVDDNSIKQLREDIASWKSETLSRLEKMNEELQQSTRQALEEVKKAPTLVQPQNPPPILEAEPEDPENVEEDRPAAKTKRKAKADHEAAAPARPKRRFL